MGLSQAVVGARHIAQQITWKDEDGTVLDLTGATISGVKRNKDTDAVTALDGTFNITDAENGVFTWTYGATDVGAAGIFGVQFTATYGASDLERTLLHTWKVIEALTVS